MAIQVANPMSGPSTDPPDSPSTTSQPLNHSGGSVALAGSTLNQQGLRQIPMQSNTYSMSPNRQGVFGPSPMEHHLPTNQIIPDEDPQRDAESYDDDDFDAIGDGLGEEDCDDDEVGIGDEDGSDDNEMEHPPCTDPRSQKTRRPLPNWLHDSRGLPNQGRGMWPTTS